MSVPSWAEPYIEQMNGDVARGFFWQDATSFKWYLDTQGRSVTFDPKSISYWYGASAESDYHTNTLGGSTLLTVNVTGSDSSWNMTATGYRRNIDFANGGNIYGSAWQIWKNQDNSYTIQAISSGNPQDALNFSRSALSLEAMIQYIANFFKNIKLFVNGEDWTAETTYNWQSVPSISGKNGILSLVTLDSESINDGEPVSGAAVSVFDQNPVSGNNVKDIVDGNTPLIPSAVDVTAAFIISNPPVGELASRILAAKKGSIPESIEDADKTVSIPANASNVTMPGLDENSQYYFAIFVADATGDTAVSDPKDIYTSGDEGWTFDYTGEIQTFVAPKTGIYSLETWGAQGGDATDGTNTARGGYGAYAIGEVFLTQGETLYINVGGQNGYGGGGNYVDTSDLLYLWANQPMGTKLQEIASTYAETNSGAKPFFANKYDILASEYAASRHNPTITDDVILFSNPTGSNNYSWTVYYFNIQDTVATKLQVDVKVSNYVYAGCAGYARAEFADSEGNMTVFDTDFAVIGTQHAGSLQHAIEGNTWTTLEIDFSGATHINYIALGGWWGNYEFRNVKLISE